MTVQTTTRNGRPAPWTMDPASEKQTSWIKSLLHGRDVDPNTADEIRAALASGDLTKGRASGAIDLLKTYPVRSQEAAAPAARQARPALPDVAAGRYAVEVDGTLAFFKVDRPETGTYAGRTFVSQQASDTLYPVRGARRGVVLALIAADAQTALRRYGQEIGSCGHCGRTLTNDESRARGVGPDCAKRLGW